MSGVRHHGLGMRRGGWTRAGAGRVAEGAPRERAAEGWCHLHRAGATGTCPVPAYNTGSSLCDLWWILLLSLSYSWGNLGSESSSNLSNITQNICTYVWQQSLLNSNACLATAQQAVWTQAKSFHLAWTGKGGLRGACWALWGTPLWSGGTQGLTAHSAVLGAEQ